MYIRVEVDVALYRDFVLCGFVVTEERRDCGHVLESEDDCESSVLCILRDVLSRLEM